MHGSSRLHFIGRILLLALGLSLLLLGAAAVHRVGWRDNQRQKERLETLRPDIPHLQGSSNYVTSFSCQSCHPDQHASWHRTYHRTMTQLALPENVVGAFDGTTIPSDGLNYRVTQDDKGYWAEMPDPDVMMYVVQGGKRLAFEDIPRVRQPVVMATGSHHYQTYWVASPRYDRLLQTLPLVYLIKDKRWIPREAAFMRPPAAERMVTQWNHHCIRCHSTGGNPGLNAKTGMLDSRVGELGISCEACHGPGDKHIAANSSPLRRYESHLGDRADPTIVNPKRLDHRRSSQVCGQCHGVYIMRDEFAMQSAYEGGLFRPGDDLDRTRYYIQHPLMAPSTNRQEDLERNPEFFRERWWDDGSILAGGREYTALSVTGCYLRGQMSCLTCHSMHESDPVDQLKPGMDGDRACTQCHDQPQFTRNIERHTRHRPGSTGSACMNCHMPYTTYALLGAIRSHQIASPNPRASAQHGVPNACNLCHLDKTLAWTRQQLTSEAEQSQWSLTAEQEKISAALLWLLKGDAAQRAITAWHVGWKPAQEISGADWLAPFQAQLLADPYGVVRYVAWRALQTLPAQHDVQIDFLASAETLRQQADQIVSQWLTRTNPPSRTGPAVLLDSTGQLMGRQLRSLLNQRNNRPVTIQE